MYVDGIKWNGHGILKATPMRCRLLGSWVDKSWGYRLKDSMMCSLIVSSDTRFVETDLSDTIKSEYTTVASGLIEVQADHAPAVTHLLNVRPDVLDLS
jgi:hypothetical protein